MVYYTGAEYKICEYIACYTAYGEQKRAYTNDRSWWESFVLKWWHHENLSFLLVVPTTAQLDRLSEINALNVPELYMSAVATYVEVGVVLEDVPAIAGLSSSVDLSNTIFIWEYEQLINKYIQAEVDKYNKAQGTAFNSIHSCGNYRHDVSYTHQPFCAEVWAWNINVWEASRNILYNVSQGVEPILTAEEFISKLPVFGEANA